MEVYDDRPVSVYDNLKTTPNNIHTSTPKAVKRGNTVPSPAASPLSTRRAAATATATTVETTAANRATSSPIYADIAFKFNDNNQLTNQQSQQPHLKQQPQQQQPLPRLTQQYAQQSTAQSLASNFTDQAPTTTATAQHFATNTTLPTQSNNNSTNNYTNSSNQRLIQANVSLTLPAPAPAPASALASAPIKAFTTATPAAMSTTTTSAMASTVAAPRNASPAQRPLSQHSQSELYEASQSIAAVKAALNDAKSKFFGLNGYAQEHPHNNTYSANESRPLQQRGIAPRLLIDNQYPKVQIVTTAPTPPPKSQPKYQNIPENSAIFRNNAETPPELPPKPPGELMFAIKFDVQLFIDI